MDGANGCFRGTPRRGGCWLRSACSVTTSSNPSAALGHHAPARHQAGAVLADGRAEQVVFATAVRNALVTHILNL